MANGRHAAAAERGRQHRVGGELAAHWVLDFAVQRESLDDVETRRRPGVGRAALQALNGADRGLDGSAGDGGRHVGRLATDFAFIQPVAEMDVVGVWHRHQEVVVIGRKLPIADDGDQIGIQIG